MLPSTILMERNELELDLFTYNPEGSRDSVPRFPTQSKHRQTEVWTLVFNVVTHYYAKDHVLFSKTIDRRYLAEGFH